MHLQQFGVATQFDRPRSEVLRQQTNARISATETSRCTRFADFKTAIIRLGAKMLSNRNLYPRWSDVASWFSGEERLPDS